MKINKKISKKDYVRLVSDALGISQKEIERILKGISEVNTDCLMDGFDVPIDGIGTIGIKYVKPREEKEFRNVKRGETFMSPPVDEHNKLYIKFSSVIKKQLKEKTLGNPFNKPE